MKRQCAAPSLLAIVTRQSAECMAQWDKESEGCPACAEVTFGVGALDYRGPDDVHPQVTCAEVKVMES